MCLIVLGWKAHPSYPLVLAANRDEFHSRPTAPASFWEDQPQLLAGRDLQAGGTWLGLTRSGRFAAITNYREPDPKSDPLYSRGTLVRDYLLGDEDPAAAAASVAGRGDDYAGFSLLLGDREALWWVSNRADGPRPVEPGVHGLSNHGLNTPWPKVEKARSRLREQLERPPAIESILDLLGDRSLPPDDRLPDTGIGIERERLLAPLFIVTPLYGTRSSTVLLVDDRDQATFVECSFDGEGKARGSRGVAFSFEPRP